MNRELQLKLQAFLDDELPEGQARDVVSWVARDPEAAALLQELRLTRECLAGFESEMETPASREFYWSRIEREIRRIELEPLPAALSPLACLRRWLVPAGSLAALAIFVAFAALQSGLIGPSSGWESKTTSADAGTFTYSDYSSGTTLVWVNYPAER